MVDIDLDGELDIVGSDRTGNSHLLRNDPAGNFTVQGLDLSFVPTSFDSGDMDGDGDIDLIFSNWNGQVGWLERVDQSDQLEFTMRTLYVGARTHVAIADDLDLDGDLDILSGSEEGVVWLENLRLQQT